MNQKKEENNNGIDLSGSFNDSDVKFNEQRPQTPLYFPGTPKIIQWVIKYSGGLIKNEKQAQYVILGFVAIAIIISLFLIFGGESETEIKAPPGSKIIYPPNEPSRLQQSFE